MQNEPAKEGEGREDNQIVESIVEEPGKEGYYISFQCLAAIYTLDKNSPEFPAWLELLKKSLTEEKPVNFRYLVGGSNPFTYVELVSP